jgi:thiamine-monophosphate kinase
MKIEELGGEFALIDRLATLIPSDHVDLIAGIGDDAAVIRTSPEPAPYLLATTDILVEHRHFTPKWAKPIQVGTKAAECNISDIAAMGGRPSWMFISLVLTKQTEVAWAEGLYAGISASCRRHGVVVAGGDTTQGPVNTINIALMGTVSQENLCLRSRAQPGDRLMVTGSLGASAAALSLKKHGRSPTDYLLEKHLSPVCRLDVSETIAPLANAMIDISDGLGSEVRHICRQSDVGAEVLADAIPIHDDVRSAGEVLAMDPMDFALYGGEDFELLFSIPEEKVQMLIKNGLSLHSIGRITEEKTDPILITAGEKRPIMRGFDHFK